MLLCHRPIGCTLIFILLVFGIILYRIFCWYLLAPQKLVEIILVFCESLSTTHFSFFHIFAFKCLSVCLAGHDVCIGVGCYGFIQIIFNIHVLFNYVGTGWLFYLCYNFWLDCADIIYVVFLPSCRGSMPTWWYLDFPCRCCFSAVSE